MRLLPTKAASDVTSGVAVEWVSLDVRVNYRDSGSNRSRDMRPTHLLTDEQCEQQLTERQKQQDGFEINVSGARVV